MTRNEKLIKIVSFLTKQVLTNPQKAHEFVFSELYNEYFCYDVDQEYEKLMEEKEFKEHIPMEKMMEIEV